MSRNFGGAGQSWQEKQSRKVAIISLALLIILFGAAALLLIPALNSTPEKATPAKKAPIFFEAEPEVEMVSVLIPVRRLSAGEALVPEMFRLQSMADNKVPARSVRSFQEVQGYFVRKEVFPNQPLTSDAITSKRPNSAITANIPEGYRAVTIQVDERTSVEGWARPGVRVDVLWSTDVSGEKTVATIVYNAKVLSAQRQTSAEPPPNPDGSQPTGPAPVPTTVTLLVTSEDAAKIQLAISSGVLSLSLRGEGQGGVSKPESPLTLRDLLQGAKKQGNKAAAKGRVRIPRREGGYDEFVLQENGELVPVEQEG